MRSWNLGSGTETAKFLMWLVHYFCSRWCPCTAAARDVSPADRPCSPLCWGAPLYVHTPHAGQHAQSYVDSSGARFRNCQDGGRRAPTNTLNQPVPPGARAGILSAPPAPCFRQVPRNTPGRPSKYQARPGELPNGPPGGASPLRGPGYGVFRTGKGLPPRGGKKSEGNRQNRHVHPRQ